jgi:hypothetical protein
MTAPLRDNRCLKGRIMKCGRFILPTQLTIAAVLLRPLSCDAFELTTHALMTQYAYEASNLAASDGRILMDLGLGFSVWGPDSNIPISALEAGPTTYVESTHPFGRIYMDSPPAGASSGVHLPRQTDTPESLAYVEGIIRNFVRFVPAESNTPFHHIALTLPDWLVRGSIREDDINAGDEPLNPVTPDTGGDPFGEIYRLCNHFYDPLNDAALSASAVVFFDAETRLVTIEQLNPSVTSRADIVNPCGEAYPMRAPAWGIGVIDPYALPTTPNPNRRNHFSIADAVSAEYTALTGRDSTGNTVAATSYVRNAYWATMFHALGDAMHMLEDMAQPQHTRPEFHPNLPIWDRGALEKHIEDQAQEYGNAMVVGATAPASPTVVSAIAGDGAATVSFAPPSSGGLSAVKAYTVTSNPDGLSCSAATSPITVSGLTNGTAYTFAVTATNAAGTSTPSAQSNSVVPAAALHGNTVATACDFPPQIFPHVPAYVPIFPSYLQFWTSRSDTTMAGQAVSLAGSGLADYSNHGFFTVGHNFDVTNTAAKCAGPLADCYANPPSDDTAYLRQTVSGVDASGYSYLKEYLVGFVSDNVALSQIASTNLSQSVEPASAIAMVAKSSWPGKFGEATYALDNHVYEQQVSLLIPRAIGYAAGLLNYYFRGRLAITAPTEGVYGIVDHGPFSAPNSAGFNKIKVMLQNATPDIPGNGTTYPQNMQGGRLTAVLKYHLNTCYQGQLTAAGSDLQGEPGAPTQTLSKCYGDDEQIAVSDAVEDASGKTYYSSPAVTSDLISLSTSDPPREFTFYFNNPMPVNVMDVYLQVIYRGQFGTDGDAVIVTTKDISEPSYFSIFNATDALICINGQWFNNVNDGFGGVLPSPWATAAARQAGLPVPTPFTFPQTTVWLGASSTPPATPLIVVKNFVPNTYFSFAVLMDGQAPLWNQAVGGAVQTQPYPFDPEINSVVVVPPAVGAQPGNLDLTVNETRLKWQVRGKNVWQYIFWYADSGTYCTDVPLPFDRSDDLDAFGLPFSPLTLIPISGNNGAINF